MESLIDAACIIALCECAIGVYDPVFNDQPIHRPEPPCADGAAGPLARWAMAHATAHARGLDDLSFIRASLDDSAAKRGETGSYPLGYRMLSQEAIAAGYIAPIQSDLGPHLSGPILGVFPLILKRIRVDIESMLLVALPRSPIH